MSMRRHVSSSRKLDLDFCCPWLVSFRRPDGFGGINDKVDRISGVEWSIPNRFKSLSVLLPVSRLFGILCGVNVVCRVWFTIPSLRSLLQP